MPRLRSLACLQLSICISSSHASSSCSWKSTLRILPRSYCLDKVPSTFDEFVYWVCDDCEVKVPNELTIMNSVGVLPENCTSSRHLKASSEAKLDIPPSIAEVDLTVVQNKSPEEDVEKHPRIDLVEHSHLDKKSNPTSLIDKKNCIHAVVEQAQPVLDPIWRGSFNIWNKEYKTFDGLVAHLSVKACQKVFEEAKLFSLLLHLEMLPKSDIWPKSFYTLEPRDDNIALYFFPSDARYEQDFDHLIEEMIGEELALRAVMTNAELLVFTSTELPLHNWRFQHKHYLWGVFRAKQESSSCQMVSNRVKSVILQTPGNVLTAGDHMNLVKLKTSRAESPISTLSNNVSFGSGTS